MLRFQKPQEVQRRLLKSGCDYERFNNGQALNAVNVRWIYTPFLPKLRSRVASRLMVKSDASLCLLKLTKAAFHVAKS